MGGVVALCGVDTPCVGSGSEKDVRRSNLDRPTSINTQKVPLLPTPGHHLDLTSDSSDDSGPSSKDSGQKIQAIRSDTFITRESTIYTVPTKKIFCPPIIAKYILLNETFIEIRNKMESNALTKYKEDIHNIVFRTDHWLIQGPDAFALEEHRDLFDIIIWRVPIIPAFAHFTDNQQFHDELFDENDTDINIEGIWSLLSKEQFIKMFNAKLLTEIDCVDNGTYSYLECPETFPSHTEEYKTLVDDLKTIEPMKKSNEIIIIGQRSSAKDILRVIRQKEVKHSSIQSMFRLKGNSMEWEIDCNDANAPDPNFISSHYCIISNVPLRADQDQLEAMLAEYSRWTYASVMDQDESEQKVADTDRGSDDEEYDEDYKGNTLGYKFGRIDFDNYDSLKTFIDDIEGEGIYLGSNKISFLRQNKELKKRKRRRLYGGHMIV